MPVRIVSDSQIQEEQAIANGQEVKVEVIRPDNVIQEQTDSWIVEKKELNPIETDGQNYDPPLEEPQSKMFPDNVPLWVWIGIGLLIVGGLGGVVYFMRKK